MPLFLDNSDVEQSLTMKDCMEALETLYRELGEGRAVASPRSDIHTPTAAAQSAEGPMAHYLKSMSGASPHFGTAALRFSSDIVAWRDSGGGLRREKLPALPGNRWLGIVMLFSSANGELLAIMKDGVLQRMRVGGANGVATKYLARRDAENVGLIGSGWQAGSQVMAVCEARRIKKIKVYSPTRANRERFAKEMSASVGVEIVPVDSQAEAVRGADIVITATNSRKPFLGPAALSEGVHLSCMQRDEAEPDALRRCRPLVLHTHLTENNATSSDLEVYNKEGFEIRDHPAAWRIDWKSLPTLPDLVTGRIEGRSRDDQITGFVNNIGLGAQFAAVGAKVYETARARGLGRELPIDWFTQDVHP
ncbi:MAG TPA: ornithine cyclodeaminase family protein [candidate division Zixibacteria bacterium]|nr:ornithine cyclodeaminase family protein [candidate division Zixibacteria bacterium]